MTVAYVPCLMSVRPSPQTRFRAPSRLARTSVRFRFWPKIFRVEFTGAIRVFRSGLECAPNTPLTLRTDPPERVARKRSDVLRNPDGSNGAIGIFSVHRHGRESDSAGAGSGTGKFDFQ